MKLAEVMGIAILVSAMACAGSLPTVPVSTRAPTPPMTVPSPPPPALPETISKMPEVPEVPGELRWVDGFWRFSVGRWVWFRGGWVILPRGVTFFPGNVEYRRDGAILYWSPAWVDENGAEIEDPRIVAPADTPSAARSVEGMHR